jgi:anti-anti-sigma factor
MATLSTPSPRLRLEAARGRTRVTFLGIRLDAADVAAVQEHLAGVRGRPLLRLDLSRVEYLTAATLTALLALGRGVRAARGRLTLENAGPLVYELFEVAGLTGLLNVRARSAAPVPARTAV